MFLWIYLKYLKKYKKDFKNLEKNKESINISNIDSSNISKDQKVYLETLGNGKIIKVENQKTLIQGKYNLIFDVQFNIGQFCRFSKIFKL